MLNLIVILVFAGVLLRGAPQPANFEDAATSHAGGAMVTAAASTGVAAIAAFTATPAKVRATAPERLTPVGTQRSGDRAGGWP